ncbi:hypothetical protein [Lysobacter changpingensis]|uniref:hypothetical protein n=1 Tax=Lysobacter changpingensis TaxID=2792784 RepID=UPI0031BA8BB4
MGRCLPQHEGTDIDAVRLQAKQVVEIRNSDNYTQLIEVSMAYRKITWEHTVAGTSGSDDWRAPLTA